MASVSQGMTSDRGDGRDRNEHGQYTQSVTLDTIEVYLREHCGAATGELAEAFDVTTETIRRKCRTLEEQGRVRARSAGPATFWQPVGE